MEELAPSMIKLGGAIAFAFGAIGSALGTGTAAMAGIGAWKKCYIQNKPAPFTLLIFIGAPLSQTIYGLLFAITYAGYAENAANFSSWPMFLGAGIVGGMAIGYSAWFQGKTSAAANDAIGETGQGLVNNIISIGIVETVALFITFLMGLALVPAI